MVAGAHHVAAERGSALAGLASLVVAVVSLYSITLQIETCSSHMHFRVLPFLCDCIMFSESAPTELHKLHATAAWPNRVVRYASNWF